MHSYNGVTLPSPPKEWDKERFPFAHLVYLALFKCYVFNVTSCPLRYYPNGYDGNVLNKLGATETDAQYMAYEFYTPQDTNWVTNGKAYPLSGLSDSGLFWSNFDILNSDGSVYLAASDPIPITAPALDPLSLFLGWKAGNWVARQRGKIQQWETIFDEQVTFVKDGAMFPKHYIHFGQGNNVLALGDILRVTVDGVLYDLEMEEYTENCIGAGNKYLYDAESDDNGLDFMIFAYFIGMYEGEAISYRTEGTHSIKIERRLVE